MERRTALYDLRSLKVHLDLLAREAGGDSDMQTAFWLDQARCYVASACTRVESQHPITRQPLATGQPVESEIADA